MTDRPSRHFAAWSPAPQPGIGNSTGTGCLSPDRCYNYRVTAQDEGVDMLDAYIIERIRRERESRQVDRRPVLEMPNHRPPTVDDLRRERDREEQQRRERGIAIIDFSI